MSEELTREEFEERLAQMKEQMGMAANQMLSGMKAAVDRQMETAEASAAALKRIADAFEPTGKMIETFLRAYVSVLKDENEDIRYFPCCPECKKDFVHELGLTTAEERINHVQDCLVQRRQEEEEGQVAESALSASPASTSTSR